MRRSSFLLLSLVLLTIVSSVVKSAVPPRINYQGRVTDNSGSPLPDGNQILRFSIYDLPTGGTALWSSGLREVTVSDGLFSYILGDSSLLPLDIFNAGTDFYLGIKFGSDPETILMLDLALLNSLARSRVVGSSGLRPPDLNEIPAKRKARLSIPIFSSPPH